AHGTGTRLGDPMEVEALTEAFRKDTSRNGFCAIGSVKSNMGHAIAAAGVASLLKTLLALRPAKLPPTLHCERENEHIPVADAPFYLNRTLREWEVADGQPRRAAVSSFGFSGTNAHVVVEQAPEAARPRRVAKEGPWLFL